MKKIIKQRITVLAVVLFVINSINAQNVNFKLTKITNNIYSVVSLFKGLQTPESKGWNSNIHFVVTKKGVLLFDTGSSETIGIMIKETIRSITDKPVRWVINSHSHANHWLGNAAFPKAEIITSEKTLRTMKEYGEEDVSFYKKNI